MSAPPIRIGIVGYGNLGRGVELAIGKNPDMVLAAVFTRRDPASLQTAQPDTPVHPMQELDAWRERIDVLVLCGGSKTDLPEQSPRLAERFCIVDSFDTHARIPEHFAAVDAAARRAGTVALIAAGWDPGLFSIQRVLGEALLPDGTTYTFWGKGLSQGHSDAIRRVPGVAAGVQYTLPREAAIEQVRSGQRPDLATRDRHARECFVVLEEGADPDTARQAIVTMPDYFADYDTTVHFIDRQTLEREHTGMPHGGFVLRSGNTSAKHQQLIEYRLALDHNPEFTASVLTACARAVHRLHKAGETGARTVFDIAPAMLSSLDAETLRKKYL